MERVKKFPEGIIGKPLRKFITPCYFPLTCYEPFLYEQAVTRVRFHKSFQNDEMRDLQERNVFPDTVTGSIT